MIDPLVPPLTENDNNLTMIPFQKVIWTCADEECLPDGSALVFLLPTTANSGQIISTHRYDLCFLNFRSTRSRREKF